MEKSKAIYEINFPEKIRCFDISQCAISENLFVLGLEHKLVVGELLMQEGQMDWKIIKELYISHPFSLLRISPETSIKISVNFAAVNSSFEIQIFNSSMDPKDPEMNTVRTLRGHVNYINSIAFSSDSQLLASASDDHTCCIWKVKDGEDNLLTVLNFSSSVTSVQFGNADEAEKLIIGEKCGTIFVYCLKLNQSIYSFQTRQSPLFDLDWSTKNSQFVAVAADGYISYFDILKSPVPLIYSKKIHEIVKMVRISKNNSLVTGSVGGKSSNDLKVIHQKSQIPIISEKLVSCSEIAWHFSQPLLMVVSDRKLAVYKVQVA